MGLRLRGEAWWLRKAVDGVTHEIPLGVYGGEPNRKQAEKAASKAVETLMEARTGRRVMASLGLPIPAKKAASPTLAEWWVVYEETYTSLKAARTQARDRSIMAHWLPLLGTRRLDDIKQVDCLNAIYARRASNTGHKLRKTQTKLAEGSVQRERRLLHAIFERAVENGVLDKNPWKGIKGKADKVRQRLLTEADEVKLIDAMRATRPDAVGKLVTMHPRHIRFIQFMLQTGLRIEECLGIDPATDIHPGYVHVTGKFNKERDVPLTRVASQLLAEQLQADGALWTSTQQNMRGMLDRACAHAGIGRISPHDLRHTFGHRWLTRGGDIYTLSKVLGHASIVVTEKHYAHLLKEDIGAKMRAIMDGPAA